MDHRPRDEEGQPGQHHPGGHQARRSLRVAPAAGKVVPFQPRRTSSRRVPPMPPRRRFNANWIWVSVVALALVLPYLLRA